MLPERSGGIPLTQWTLVDAAGQGRPEALGEFLKLYRRAMVTHLVVRQRWQQDDAEDIVQGFIVDKICTRNVLAAADRKRGRRFRSFLLTVLDRYAGEQRRAARRLKRSPDHALPLDEKFDGAVSAGQPDDADVQWARDLLIHSIRCMEQECAASGRAHLFAMFRQRVLEPALSGTEPLGYGELVAVYGFASPLHASNALTTAKRMLQRHVREAIRDYARDESEIDDEIQELFDAVSNA